MIGSIEDMGQLIAHLVGDYWLQSDWIAVNKSKKSLPCLIHVCLYVLPFLFLTFSWKALLIIGGSHFLLERAGHPIHYLIWFKNHLDPQGYPAWNLCSGTGYFDEQTEAELQRKPELIDAYNKAKITHQTHPLYISIWLTIITDNSMHLLCNFMALKYFAG